MHQRISRYAKVSLDSSYPQFIHFFEVILVDNTLFASRIVMVYWCGEKWGKVGKLEKEVVGMTIWWVVGPVFRERSESNVSRPVRTYN